MHGTIINVATGECLSGNGVASGGAVKLDACDPNTTSTGAQFWSLVPTSIAGVVRNLIRNGKTGLCLDGGTLPGTTPVRMVGCLTERRQRWSLTANAPSSTEITEEQTGQLMGAFGSNSTDMFNREFTNRQRWVFTP